MEHIIVSNVMKHLDENKILSEYQHGFRNQRSCESQLIGLVHDLTSNMDKNYQTDMIVLDFAKAFDKVSHPRLLHKLEHYGIHGNNNNWIKSFLNNRTQAVALENTISDNLCCSCSGDVHDIKFIHVKCHFPFSFQFNKLI
jgi:hypothetical protein